MFKANGKALYAALNDQIFGEIGIWSNLRMITV